MIQLTEKERKLIRASLIKDLIGGDDRKTPAANIQQKIDVLMGQKVNDENTEPAIEVEDIDEEDIGDFPGLRAIK